MRRIMERLKLTVNEEKTHLCEIPRERFDFLGYTFGRCYSSKDGHAYIGTRPSKKSIKRMVASISEVTDRRTGLLDAEEIVGRLNRKLTGWANYFCLGPVSPAYQALDTTLDNGYAGGCARSTRLRARGQRASPTSICTRTWGWFDWRRALTTFRGRKHECLSESRDAGKSHARFDERDVETEPGSGS